MAHTLFVPLMLTLGAGLATGIGSTIALFAHRTNKRLLSFSLGLSGGVMIYVSFVELFQQAREAIGAIYGPQTGMGITTLAFFGGVLLIVVGLRDLIMAVLILVLAQHDYGPLPVHFVGKAGTAILLIAIVALIFADIWSNSAADTLHLCGLATGIWGVGLYWLAGYIYMRQGIQLLKNDTNSKD